ncbi:MAG: hypothetical protein IKS75_08355 [Clostridiales bacterium]|nr:hypothetical protein [Clostridiales bacterium]
MVLSFYIVIFALSLACCILFFCNKRNYYPVLYAMVYILSLLSHACYVLLAKSMALREALIINKFIYIGGCFFPLVGLMIIMSICQIKLPKWAVFFLLIITATVFGISTTAGYSPIFYKDVTIEMRYGVTVLIKEYGPLHILFYLLIGSFLIATLVVLAYGWFKKPNISKRDLAIAAFMQIFSIFCYFVGRMVMKEIEWMALADLVDEIGFLLIMNHIGLYRVDDLVISSIQNEGKVGFIAMDFKKRYLSATDVAKRFIPEIADNPADHIIKDDNLRDLFDKWIDQYSVEKMSVDHTFHKDKSIYLIHVQDLYDGNQKRGYLLEITDDTEHLERMEDIERYNMNLNRELIAKSKKIKELESQKESSAKD